SESLSLVVQPRQRETPRVRPDPGTATVCESGQIHRPFAANTCRCPTLHVGEPTQGEQGADQCASPGGRVCRRLWCPEQGGGNIGIWEIPLRTFDLRGDIQHQQRAATGAVLCWICSGTSPTYVTCRRKNYRDGWQVAYCQIGRECQSPQTAS